VFCVKGSYLLYCQHAKVVLYHPDTCCHVCGELTFKSQIWNFIPMLNPLTHNDTYRGRTAPLTSKSCILYIYSTNIGTEYFKHGIHSPCFSLQNTVCFIILTYLVPVLFTFYIQCVLKFKIKSGVTTHIGVAPHR